MDADGVTRIPRRQLELEAAAQLRDVILAREPNTQIGSSRRRILEAILKQDEELAQFEAERYRRLELSRLRETADTNR